MKKNDRTGTAGKIKNAVTLRKVFFTTREKKLPLMKKALTEI